MDGGMDEWKFCDNVRSQNIISFQSGFVFSICCHGDLDLLHPILQNFPTRTPVHVHTHLLASWAREVVNGAPDSPVDQDPGLEFLIKAGDVFVHIPALLSAEISTQSAVRGQPGLSHRQGAWLIHLFEASLCFEMSQRLLGAVRTSARINS